MELRIISPQEGGFIKNIQWNNEELKKEIAIKMEDYRGLAFTAETIKEAKKDRANLNKLKTAFEDERKRIKRLCMAPYEQFETQVKEVVALIEEPIQIIDAQIKEVEENRRVQKQKDIEELFKTIGFQRFVSLEGISDPKWLNVGVSLSQIEESMKSTMYRIGNEITTINNLPEFSFEALEIYKKTLDMSLAIQEGQRLSEIQKRKTVYEEEQKRQAAQAAQAASSEIERTSLPSKAPHQEKLYTIDFRVETTQEKLELLKNFFRLNNIKYSPIQKGE